ncbi:MAG: prepilin-type N-terminal cleavage/methylation domain-containing protein [Candidatus Riflebacteria bacterium]
MNRKGFSLIEALIAVSIFSLVSFAIYQTVWQYSRSYMKTDDKLENLAEAWQILRLIQEDFDYSDFPDGDIEKWKGFITSNSGSFSVNRRYENDLVSVCYRFDSKRGDLYRKEGDNVEKRFLDGRLKEILIIPVTKPSLDQLTGDSRPWSIHFRVKLVIANSHDARDNAAPIELESIITPSFSNLRLKGEFFPKLLPEEIEKS